MDEQLERGWGGRSQWRWDQVLLFPSTFVRQLSVHNTWESLSKFGHKKQRSSWFMNPTRNLYPWLVFTVTIKLVYSVMARPSILSTCVLAEQIIHCKKNNMRTQHVQKTPTLPDRKEDSRNILCAFQNAVLGWEGTSVASRRGRRNL